MSSQASLESPAESPPPSSISLSPAQENDGSSTHNGTKTDFPAPPSASLTPPPSSQQQSRRSLATSLHHPSALNSPPPTVVNGVHRDIGGYSNVPSITADQMSSATADELREFLKVTIAANEKLEATAAEARMSAAHYKLQHNLLTIETEEAAKRMEVEHEMTRREIDVLQQACRGRDNPGQEYIAKLKAYCYSVEKENVAFKRRLENAKKLIEIGQNDLATAKYENAQLVERIIQNRQHLNLLRSPGGIFHVATPRQGASSYPATPQQYRSTPKSTPMTGRSMRQARDHSQEPFAALLLADRVLSQENNSAPSTPILSRRNEHHTPLKHSRAAQSLSSLPTTPRSGRPGTANSTLLPSVQFAGQERTVSSTEKPVRERRRKSRDSTISASDSEEIARAVSSYREQSADVQESQASQNAAEMLRLDPRESFEIAASRTHTPTPTTEKSTLLQAKIFGTVTKSGAGKRKRIEEDIDHLPKKPRGDMVGLGIGFHSGA